MAAMPSKDSISKQKNGKKRIFRLPLSAWLSYLVAATILFSSVSLAKYTAKTSDGDGARVAKFEVSASADLLSGGSSDSADRIVLSTSTLNSQSCTLKVQNTSEVVVNCTIILANIPYRVAVSKDGGEYISSDESEEAESYDVTYDAGVLNIGEQKEYTFTFKAANEYTKIGNYEMSIKIRFDQMD